jgi:flagellar biosynthesis protein FliQ
MLEITLVVGILTALVQAVREMFKMPSRFAPGLAIVLGITYTIFFGDLSIQEEIFTGLLAGLISSGLYDNAKIGGKVVLDKLKK